MQAEGGTKKHHDLRDKQTPGEFTRPLKGRKIGVGGRREPPTAVFWVELG